MIISTSILQDIAQKILSTINTNDTVNNTDQLQLSVTENRLHLAVASDEYFVDIQLPFDVNEKLHAVVNANVFLKLITQTSTDNITLYTENDQTLHIKGNGDYVLPLLYGSNGEALHLDDIRIFNPTQVMTVSSDILTSLLKYNAKQLGTVKVASPLQRVFYLDEQGAITFTEGACINNFTLPQPTRVLLSLKLVKLFKLFQKDEPVNLTIGYDSVGGSEEIIQTKIKLCTPLVSISAILACDDSLLNSYPAKRIRESATANYPYSTTISKELLQAAVNRLLLFYSSADTLQPVGRFEFREDDVVIKDNRTKNAETVDYVNSIDGLHGLSYSAILNLNELKATLETCVDPYLTLHFGSDIALVIARSNVYNVIPQRGKE